MTSTTQPLWSMASYCALAVVGIQQSRLRSVVWSEIGLKINTFLSKTSVHQVCSYWVKSACGEVHSRAEPSKSNVPSKLIESSLPHPGTGLVVLSSTALLQEYRVIIIHCETMGKVSWTHPSLWELCSTQNWTGLRGAGSLLSPEGAEAVIKQKTWKPDAPCWF